MSNKDGFEDIDGILCADGVSLSDIAKECGTPSYVYSAARLSENAKRLQAAFLKVLPESAQPLIAFACKANSNLAVLNLLGKQGLGADVVSGGELVRAIRAKIPPSRIVFSGVGKTDDEILSALEAGIAQINVESASELERIIAIAKEKKTKAPVALRMNPDVDAKTHEKITTGKSENKFGLPIDDVLRLYKEASQNTSLSVQGLSLHIGSQLTSLDPFREAFERMAAVARQLINEGMAVRSLDLGGGLGIVYEKEDAPCLDGYAALVLDIIHPLSTKIILEPGRLMSGNAGLLLSKVIHVKETDGRRYVVLDAGMNDLVRPAMYDAYHPIRPVSIRKGALTPCDIVGPVCETGDTFARDRRFPPVEKGDLVAIMAAGAYGFSMASRYNTRPLPAEIMTRENRFFTIRQREGIEDIMKSELIPDGLDLK